MTLAVAIPVWNDASGLSTLLAQIGKMGCFDQLVVVDDGSDQAVALSHPELLSEQEDLQAILLRNESSKGAGQARNRALEVVTCEHLVFFDSDDLFTAEFPRLWRQLAGRVFDFCIYKHHDSRVLDRGDRGQMVLDAALWRLAGCAVGELQELSGQAVIKLAETANYPWNKIYRTNFLREQGLRFSEIPVHNDIAMHWDSFSRASVILASDRVAATHIVQSGGQRLTNRRSVDRLRVFEPLRHVADEIRTQHGNCSDLMLAFLRFSSGLIDWVRGNITEELRPDLDRKTAGFLDQVLEENVFPWLSRADPILALRLTLLMVQGEK